MFGDMDIDTSTAVGKMQLSVVDVRTAPTGQASAQQLRHPPPP